MPDMLQIDVVNGWSVWLLWNMTTKGENFCEKWNKDPRRAAAFFTWHAKALLTSKRSLRLKAWIRCGVFSAAFSDLHLRRKRWTP